MTMTAAAIITKYNAMITLRISDMDIIDANIPAITATLR
jgi:hypothetical protein